MATMSSNLANAFFPLELILKFFALGNFENLPGKLNAYFSNLYVIILWLIYFSISIYLQNHNFICQDIIGFIMFNTKLFTMMITVIGSQYYKQVCYLLFQTIELFQIFILEIHVLPIRCFVIIPHFLIIF